MLHHIPKPFGEATIGEKVGQPFLRLIAKWAATTIVPTTSLKMICCPNSILDGQPSKEFDH
jgi:hypothetical protein